jgi:ABC-type antimicrobial peptide transport system permease subunit
MIKTLQLLFVAAIFVAFSSFNTNKNSHPYFVSVTEIEHNTGDKILEVSCKIFTDDFEKGLRIANGNDIDLLNSKNQLSTNKQVADYIKKHLQITVDGNVVDLQFLGYEKEGEAIWSYFQAENILQVKKVEVMNDILFEYKKEQTNLLHVTVNGKRKSTKLNNPQATIAMEW